MICEASGCGRELAPGEVCIYRCLNDRGGKHHYRLCRDHWEDMAMMQSDLVIPIQRAALSIVTRRQEQYTAGKVME